MTAEVLIAALLLTSPPASSFDADGTERLPAPVPDAWLAVLRPSLIALAVDAEILDAREIGSIFNPLYGDNRGPFDGNYCLADLQGRWQTLLHAPRVAEADRFPARPLLDTLLQANRAERNHLAARLAIDLIFADEIRAEIGELDCTYAVVESLRDAQSPTYYVTVRRSSLASFRDRIGPAAWAAGVIPAPTCGVESAVPPELVPKRMPR